MDFEGLLLRKVEIDTDVTLDVIAACIDAVRRCFPHKTREASGEELRDLILKLATTGILEHHVFENPLRPQQIIVFARLWGAPCWIVLGEEVDGARKIITVRIHKDRSFGDEYQEVQGEAEDG